MSRIIGFNLSHDSSAAFVEDGTLVAATALERTSRVKRGVVPSHVYAAAMAELTGDVLSAGGITHADVDYWIATSTESRDQGDEDRLADSLGLLVPKVKRLALPHPGHHLAHAAAAFYTSGFDEAAALVIDAYGSLVDGGRERESGFHFRCGEPAERVLALTRSATRIAGRLDPDGTISVPPTLSGIGEIYRVVTLALGFFELGSYDDAGKTMGLAPFGRRLSSHPMFIDVGPQGLSFDLAIDSFVDLKLVVPAADGFRLVPRDPRSALDDRHLDLAAQLQAEFEEACLYLVRRLVNTTGSKSLVMGGGCSLNSVLNARVLRETPVERLWVFPAATDDGNAVGAALYAHHVLLPGEKNPAIDDAPSSSNRLRHLYLGPPRLSERDPGELARAWDLEPKVHPSSKVAARAAAEAIARGEIVGWFQDRGELGPRALGARSILCSPSIPGMKDALNARVKFRESFRPFAGAVLAEQSIKWFDMVDADSPFMLYVWPVLEAVRAQLSEIVHVDGTCRVQTVDPDLPGAFRALLEELDAITGVPVVLNTSFNLRGMPIVERMEDALDCVYGSRLDRVFLGSVEIPAPDHTRLRPVRIGDPSEPGAPGSILELANGHLSVQELAQGIGQEVDTVLDSVLELRRTGNLAWAGVPSRPAPAYPLPQYEPVTG